MTKGNTIIQVAARKVGAQFPRTLAVGPAVLEITAERTPDDGSFAKRFAAVWTKNTSTGDATIDIRPASKRSTQITVTLDRPKGVAGLLWPKPVRRRLATLLAQALAYDIETRSVEEASAFEVRRTSPELVKARAS
jgi:hypothetical protein